MGKDTNNSWWIWFAVVVIILIIIVVYVCSLGTINVGGDASIPTALKDSKDEAIKKHNLLKSALEGKIELRNKLKRRFRMAYLTVRILLVSMCAGLIFLIGLWLDAKTLSDFLNYYEVAIIVLFALNFITFGTIANFNDFISLLRTKVENWVWGKYITLPIEIEKAEAEMNQLSLY